MRIAPRHVFTVTEAAAFASGLRGQGGIVVFTNGVFDLLHPGHVRYLQDARRLGDALIVGVNSDRSVRGNKGPGRPMTPEQERAEILLALACVDAVAVFDAPTPLEIITAVQPDVLVKGEDWRDKGVVGREWVEAHGGQVLLVPLVPGCSTTNVIEKIQKLGR